MRLTLRTMLAYLDEILEPDDAADIGKKIEESEFATSLMHRLRDSARRLRLGAPATLGKGLALDPNTVAEYLDNTLESERVAEFEKICLESDVHLAELASCHEVLTLVLGEPAQVDPDVRERMYQLVHAVPRTARADAAAPPIALQPAPPPVSKIESPPVQPALRRKKPEVPDYLRTSRRSPWWSLAAVLLIGALIVAGFALAAPDRMKSMIASLTGGAPAPVQNDADRKDAESSGTSAVNKRIEQPRDMHNEPEKNVKNDTLRDETLREKGDQQADATTEAGVDSPVDAPLNSRRDVRFPENTDHANDQAAANIATDSGNANAKIADSGDAPPIPDELLTDAADTDTAPSTDRANSDSAPDADHAADVDAGPGEGLGRYLSSTDVVLRLDRKTGEWQRLPKKAALLAGDRLLSLPSYTPTISLSSGVSIQPIGAAEFELQPLDDHGVPGIVIIFGQFNMLTLGKAANPLRISFSDRHGAVVFNSPESTIALDVRRVHMPGTDPQQEPALVAAELFAMTGTISWDEEGTKSPLREPERLALTDLHPSELKEGELPRWTDYKPSDFVKRGAVAVEKAIAMDRPAMLSLHELSERPQEEVRSLAVQSAAFAGDFAPIIESLGDTSLTLIETIAAARMEALRTCLARSPETATAIREAFEKRYNDQGKPLYRMLWGYTADQLAGGEAEKLVGYLEHEELAFRALSSLALKNSTNFQIRYRPTDPPEQRKKAVKLWKDKLKEGKLGPAGTAPRAAKPDTKTTTHRRSPVDLLEKSS